MLDKKSKIVLDTLIKNGYTHCQSRFETIGKSLLPYLPKPEKYKWTFESVQACLVYLSKEGYVDYATRTNGYCTVSDCTYVHTTHKGTNYKTFKWLEVKAFLFRSILTPIVVSLITSLITVVISMH